MRHLIRGDMFKVSDVLFARHWNEDYCPDQPMTITKITPKGWIKAICPDEGQDPKEANVHTFTPDGRPHGCRSDDGRYAINCLMVAESDDERAATIEQWKQRKQHRQAKLAKEEQDRAQWKAEREQRKKDADALVKAARKCNRNVQVHHFYPDKNPGDDLGPHIYSATFEDRNGMFALAFWNMMKVTYKGKGDWHRISGSCFGLLPDKIGEREWRLIPHTAREIRDGLQYIDAANYDDPFEFLQETALRIASRLW